MAKASIRSAVTGDAEQVGQLITEPGYPTTFDIMKDRLANILTDPDHATFVVDTGAPVVGVSGATLGRYYEKDSVYARRR